MAEDSEKRKARRAWLKATDPEKLKEREQQSYLRVKAKMAASEELREQLRQRHKVRNQKKRRTVLALLGGKCRNCGIDDERVLQVDHLNGGGSQERRGRGYSAQRLLAAVREGGMEKFQLL